MKWLRVLTAILIVLIVVSLTMTIILTQHYESYKGAIKGTGFVYQEFAGAGGISYDIDDFGNIYFAIETTQGRGVTVYNNQGKYIYTLPKITSGGIRVKIDKDNSILVYDIREELIYVYNEKGIVIKVIDDHSQLLRGGFPDSYNQNIRERNGIRYININGTITKEENGFKTVVFTVPGWQTWNGACSLVMILSIVALFFRIAVPLWIKAIKARND